MKVVRVLVVDDSPTMRGLISASLRRDPEIMVVGEAADPFQARQAIKDLDPDVVTLDVEMPKMNGLEFLEKIMRLRPTPVIMVSSLTKNGAAATIQALEIGAFDCVAKPVSGERGWLEELAAKVKAAAAAPMRRAPVEPPPTEKRAPPSNYKWDGRLVAIGSSTGGVEALLTVLSHFPENCPPTVIAQHMLPMFTSSFAARLDKLCKPHVSEALDGAPIVQGHIYLAPGGVAHLEVAGNGGLKCRLRETELVNGHRPSVDVLFHSVVKTVGAKALGVILTGMGRDGADGLLAMRNAGADTIGQDQASSLVYGMPKVAFEIGGVCKQAPLQRIGPEILASTSA